MILEIDQKHIVTTDEHKWTLRARRGSLHLPPPGRSIDTIDFTNVYALATGLHRHGLIDEQDMRPCRHLYDEAEVLAMAFRLPDTDPKAAITFGKGAFHIVAGNGDVILQNPSLEVGRLRTDTDAAKVRSIVSYPATVRAALLTAVERTLMKCDIRIAYADLEQTAYNVAAELWADIHFTAPPPTPATAERIAANVRDRLRERSDRVRGSVPGERHPCVLRGRQEVIHGQR
jgi:hypothetical protein